MSDGTCARALDFEACEVYWPEKRPGYTGWASLFQFGNGDLGIAFNEIRRGRNPNYQPPSLDFVEALNFPYRLLPDILPAANPDLLSEYVCMRSADSGKTWEETGRCHVDTRHYWHVGFPDGRMVRVIGSQQYCYTMGDGRHANSIEESTDGGNTWREISRFMQGKEFSVHKVKKLRRGAIIAVAMVKQSFGPGGERDARSISAPGHIEPDQSAFLISEDGGYTWDGPHYFMPGIAASEPDFVELDDGSLLFINSSIQGGRVARQIVRRCETGWVNDPMMEVRRGAPGPDNPQGGITPESVIMTPDGLIVGVRRSLPEISPEGLYTCSDDLGENWYEIEGPPPCNYQPIIEALPDGRVLAVWHYGADSRFGEYDMYIGTHAFGVDAQLPLTTSLTLERELSADGNQYLNAFRARLTSGDTPLAGRRIDLHVKNGWLPQPPGLSNRVDLWDSPDVRQAVTDADGVARFALQDKDRIRDIHHGYHLGARFDPADGDEAVACRSPTRTAYPTTPSRTDPAPYPVYLVHALVMITPETAERFPELPDVVSHFRVPDPSATIDKWIEAAGSEKRAREILDFLMENHIVTLDEDGVYHWYRSVHSGGEGEPWIHECRVCDLEEHVV